MSVQNPERVVTKQDLADFYGEILPYLGGMPDILANKFSKGDMYSTDEKMIGQWVDGKPLYSKTISCGALPNISTVVRQNTGVSNIEMCVVMDGVAISPTLHRIKTFPLDGMDYGYDSQNNQIIISSEADYTAYTESYVTINYTKSTDSPVSIGNDTDYSTTEKIIGTWIDGKPIWQKTIDLGSNITVGNGDTWTRTSISATSIDKYVHVVGIHANGTYFPLMASTQDNVISLLTGRNVTTADVRYLTVQYTKIS